MIDAADLSLPPPCDWRARTVRTRLGKVVADQPHETETPTERTRRLSDEMREIILTADVAAYGTIVMTLGIADQGETFIRRTAEAVVRFTRPTSPMLV